MVKLSKTQTELIELLKNRENSHTLDEMAEILGLASKSTVHYHINELIKKGYLKINSNNPSDYIIIEQVGDGIAHLPVFEAQGGKDGRNPLDYPTDTLPVSSRALNFDTKSTIAIKIKGDSMSPNFPDGSYTMVDKDDHTVVENKTYLVLLHGSELVVKNVSTDKNSGGYILSSYNYLQHPPFTASFDEAKIIGKVKASLNQF
jgi:repressor LexA